MTLNSVALTSGDPAGVGPEIALAAWQPLRCQQAYFLIADRRHLPEAGETPVVEIGRPEDAPDAFARGMPLLHVDFPAPAVPGVINTLNSRTAVDIVDMALDFARSGRVSAICTNPLHKLAVGQALGAKFPGHTQHLASLCGVSRPVMMLTSPDLRVVPVTTHISHAEVSRCLTRTLLRETILICHDAMSRLFSLENPRFAVAGLNPHAGEGGTFGREEQSVIHPVVERLQEDGFNVSGPHSADSMFHADARRNYDLAICMYHDQALVPLKTLAFHSAVNVTLGLPVIRTAPDHGTALDIAGKSIATPNSLVEAVRLAGTLGRNLCRAP